MKLQIDLTEEQLSEQELFYLLTHIKRRYNTELPILNLGMCIELLIGLTHNFHTDYADPRFFNNILTNRESLIAWDGKELIDILFYEVKQAIRRHLKNSDSFL